VTRLYVAARTDIGMVRTENQDFFEVCDFQQTELPEAQAWSGVLNPVGALLAVADGVGGLSEGALASRLAAEAIAAHFRAFWLHGEPIPSAPVELTEAFREAHETVRACAEAKDLIDHMSTTAAVALLHEGKLIVGHVGDSRAYLFRAGTALQLTRDHTVVQQLVDLGQITSLDAATRHDRNILTRAIGFDDEVRPDVEEFELVSGDILLLCSDGLYNYVEDGEMNTLAGEGGAPADLAAELVTRARDRGGADNITVIVATLVEGPAEGDSPNQNVGGGL
jgi:serine/threonine protein phosphatase PrpC